MHSAEYFAARLINGNTRAVYAHPVTEFCDWCQACCLPLPALFSLVVAAYVEELRERLSPSSGTAHLTAIRQWLEWLTRSGVLPVNPAAPVRGIRLARLEGKTPVSRIDPMSALARAPEALTQVCPRRRFRELTQLPGVDRRYESLISR